MGRRLPAQAAGPVSLCVGLSVVDRSFPAEQSRGFRLSEMFPPAEMKASCLR